MPDRTDGLSGESIAGVNWKVVWGIAAAFATVMVIVNETLLIAAGHSPSLVSDADLWCIQRDRVAELDENDWLLLGASRMQTNIDLKTIEEMLPGTTVVQLAQSGLGSSFPVFKDIVENTNFRGTVLISETEATLIETDPRQQATVEHYHKRWTLDRELNKRLANVIQDQFRFANPMGSSYRLWGNLVFDRELPEANHVRTDLLRQQYSDFSAPAVVERVNRFRAAAGVPFAGENLAGSTRIANEQTKIYSVAEHLQSASNRWQGLVRNFQIRGGRIIFVRMPESSNDMKQHGYGLYRETWDSTANTFGVEIIYSPSFVSLSHFNLPDASHLDLKDAPAFTTELIKKLR